MVVPYADVEGTSNCKHCQREIAWIISSKGKKYPVNSRNSLRVIKRDIHKCGEDSFDFRYQVNHHNLTKKNFEKYTRPSKWEGGKIFYWLDTGLEMLQTDVDLVLSTDMKNYRKQLI